ncbi:MAG TPA: alcohol dehydrogenase catalytic domain-containing protein [Aggregatilineales bacterium]|jgi:threonine dehydrogenase-like Zn-dependent dehydrogenase|nr:alcohol dehydrogenase catalytic domain-containing protein [Aggregatilineales bacterium]
MRALVYDGQLRLESHYPGPVPTGDQVLLKMRRAGICNTDLELVAGYMNFHGVLGHEFVAEVIDGPAEWLGQRVVGEINVTDGTCDLCQRGMPTQCRNRSTVGIFQHQGAFADQLALTARNLHVVPDAVSDDQAVFVEPLAAAFQILEQVKFAPSDRVVLIGAGKLGMLCAQAIKLTGADLTVIVRREAQAAMLHQWGIKTALQVDLPAARAQVVVDCTGTPEGFAAALDLIEPRGTIVLKSTYRGAPQADLTRIAVEELTVIGSRCGPFDVALRHLKAGLIDVEPLIEARYPFGEALYAMQHAARRGAMKVLLDF